MSFWTFVTLRRSTHVERLSFRSDRFTRWRDYRVSLELYLLLAFSRRTLSPCNSNTSSLHCLPNCASPLPKRISTSTSLSVAVHLRVSCVDYPSLVDKVYNSTDVRVTIGRRPVPPTYRFDSTGRRAEWWSSDYSVQSRRRDKNSDRYRKIVFESDEVRCSSYRSSLSIWEYIVECNRWSTCLNKSRWSSCSVRVVHWPM